MTTKIIAVDGISIKHQIFILSEYLDNFGNNIVRLKNNEGTKIWVTSLQRNYHVGCHKTKTMLIFKIWFAV